MSVTVTCPECDDSYQVSDEAAEQLVRCRSCQCPIDSRRHEVGIQARPGAVTPRRRDDDDVPEHARPPRGHPVPRSAFPTTALLIVVIGIMFFLLAFSVGFNVWFLSLENRAFRR